MITTTEVHSIPLNDEADPFPQRAVEVWQDTTGTFWVGMTHLRDPRDWRFDPREQYGTGTAAKAMAISAANRWANGILFDQRR